MFKQYRKIDKGEFLIVAGDCSQGGDDYNACHFLSYNKLDVPLVYHTQGVAAQMTADVQPVLERIYDITSVKPVVGFERNNGGGSEMERLRVMNRERKYDLFVMPQIGKDQEGTDAPQTTKKLGYDTNVASRPTLVGDLKEAIDSRLFVIYDSATIGEMFTFIKNRNGKAEASTGAHDDLLLAFAVAIQIYKNVTPPGRRKTMDNVNVQTIARQLPNDSLFDDSGFY